MAGEASSSSASKKKGKLVRQESGKCSEIESDKCTAGSSAQTTRGGLRVYKIVVLGDGGVGKSGAFYPTRVQGLRGFVNISLCFSCYAAICQSQFFRLSRSYYR